MRIRIYWFDRPILFYRFDILPEYLNYNNGSAIDLIKVTGYNKYSHELTLTKDNCKQLDILLNMFKSTDIEDHDLAFNIIKDTKWI